MDKKSLDAIEKLIGQKIEWQGGDLPAAEVEAADADEPRNAERRDDKRRGRRGGRGRRPEKQAAAPAAETAEPQSQPVAAPKPSRPAPKERPKREGGISDDAAQLPAFLLRPVALKRRETAS